MILSPDSPDEEDLQDSEFLEVYQEATDLYGLAHARFIVSPRGLALMREKYVAGHFGGCPRVMCEKQSVLPVGLSEDLRSSRVKVFCPRCQEVYYPKQKFQDVDGAYFGTSFPHILLQSFPDLGTVRPMARYVPRIYGFKLHGHCGSKTELAS